MKLIRTKTSSYSEHAHGQIILTSIEAEVALQWNSSSEGERGWSTTDCKSAQISEFDLIPSLPTKIFIHPHRKPKRWFDSWIHYGSREPGKWNM